jgi:hypothetical protein
MRSLPASGPTIWLGRVVVQPAIDTRVLAYKAESFLTIDKARLLLHADAAGICIIVPAESHARETTLTGAAFFLRTDTV